TDAKVYGDRYLNVTWNYDGVPYRVGVRKYLANDKGLCSRIVHTRKAHGWLLGAIRKDFGAQQQFTVTVNGVMKSFDVKDEIEATFFGKASPDQIAQTCWLLTHYDFITQQAPGHQCKQPPNRTAQAQVYADYYLGVDCSGFVNNYHGRP